MFKSEVMLLTVIKIGTPNHLVVEVFWRTIAKNTSDNLLALGLAIRIRRRN